MLPLYNYLMEKIVQKWIVF